MTEKQNPETEKKEINFFKRPRVAQYLKDEDDYSDILPRANYFSYDVIKSKRRFTYLFVALMIMVVLTTVFLSLYLVAKSDSLSFVDRMIDNSLKYVSDNILLIENEAKLKEITAELNVIRTLMNYKRDYPDRQFTISELYYVSIQIPDTFIDYRHLLYEGFLKIQEGNEDAGFVQLSEVLYKMVEERK